MRALNKGWIGIVLVVLFGASLFFFRGSARYSNLFNSDNFVANVSGTQIPTSQFLRSLEMNIGQFAQMIGEELTGDQIRSFQIHQLVLQNLVNNAVFENEFDKLNYLIDDSIIAQQTKQRFPNLYVNNKINDDALNTFLRMQRLKIDDIVKIIDYETRASVFDDLVFLKNYPKELSKKINLYNAQLRKIDLLKIPYEKIVIPNFKGNSIKKDNDDLLNFFNDNSLNYMSKERRDITYIILDKSNYKKEFTPTDSEILDYFNNNKKIYTIPEKRSFIQFNFKSEEEANNFKLQITTLSKNDIIKLANENNIIFNNFKLLDSNQVLDELSEVIFSLNQDEISGVIKTALANHIIILDEIVPEEEPTIEIFYEEILKTLTSVQLDNFFNDLKLKINQQILDGFSLSEVAIENKLILKNFKDATINDENKDELELAIINRDFSKNKDFVSDINDFNLEKSFIINVDEIYQSKIENIDVVFDRLLNDFIQSKKIEFANEIFENNKLETDLNNINSFFEMNIEKITIDVNSDNLPKSLINNVLTSNIDKIVFSTDLNSVYFAKINEIIIPTETNISQDISLLSELKNAFGNEIIKTKNISINNELINGLLSQYK